ARIVPYGNFSLDPASACLHYGQAIFEGLKAYGGKDDKIRLFRAGKNMARLNHSAWRMCMPQVDKDELLQAIKTLIQIEKRWVPEAKGTSLYVRPFMIATDAFLGVRPAKEYLLSVILSPVGAYYAEGFSPVKIFVTDKYVRAVSGGVGEAKTAGNYAASLMASEKAKELGFTQVLWLDAAERRYIEEVGTMNIFFLLEDALVTPELSGSILPGITRDSVLRLARGWGLRVEERPITINEVLEKVKNKALKECFGTGTAAVISPVGALYYKGENYSINGGKTGNLAQKFFDEIMNLQYGEREDAYGWMDII
ncbi:MAG: branched-chain amino acid aminotransferase, partial [Thermodesulfobacteriota bacterium]|nr:branched-chain amino acid aminotransferase [Thermodesulfobacteriota bacterium]